MANLNSNNVLDFQDPGTLPNELLDMPGFVNELTDYTLSESHSPNRTLAFLGATAMLAHLAGRSYADVHGTRTNIYLIALGEMGIGKYAPRKTNGKLLDLVTVAESPEANAAFRQSADTLMLLRKRLADSELFTARALVVRMNEKIAKLAMIHAISANPSDPVVTGEAVAWAAKFVTHVTKAMLHEAQFHVAEGKFDALVKRFLGLLAKHGGSFDRRGLIKNLHIDHLTFRRIVMTLHMCDAIIEESECGRKAAPLRPPWRFRSTEFAHRQTTNAPCLDGSALFNPLTRVRQSIDARPSIH